ELTARLDDVGLLGGDLPGEGRAGHLRGLAHEVDEHPEAGVAQRHRPGGQRRTGEDARAHDTAVAQPTGERAGVDVADADHALVAQLVLELAHRAPARRAPGGFADDQTGDPHPVGLGVLVVDAGVADVRGGHRDDLPVVGGVGDRLLVAGHRGGEDDLPDGPSLGSVGTAREDVAVLPDEQGVRSLVPHRVPPGTWSATGWASGTVARPRGNVATTRPGRVRPGQGLLRRVLAGCAPATTPRAAGSTRVRWAGSPTARGRPGGSTRPIRAGRVESTGATPAQSSSPGSTMVSTTTDRAVSSPVMPNAASAHSQSLSSTGWGAWSVATMSMVPSASAARKIGRASCRGRGDTARGACA